MNVKSFIIQSDMRYREELQGKGSVNKFYELDNANNMEIILIPDGCVDIQFVWEENTYIPYVCGSFLTSQRSAGEYFSSCFGVRFNPGIIPRFIRDNVVEVMNGRKRLNAYPDLVLLGEELSKTDSFYAKIECFEQYFNYPKYIRDNNNSLVEYVVDYVSRNKGYINITDMVSKMSYNHKYVDRVFKNVLGMSIKKYAAIMRIQEAIEILEEDIQDEIYNTLGYYDQSHFIRNFKQYTCLTPQKYIAQKKKKMIV